MKRAGRKKQEYEEIDDFAKALLDKKTEMAIYKDLEEDASPKPMSELERLKKEETMSSALDMLRKERGQKTIQEEEKEYSLKEELDKTLDPKLTENLFKKDEDASLKAVQDILNSDVNNQVEEKIKEQEEPEKEEVVKQDEDKPKEKKKSRISKTTKIIMCLVVLGVCLMGGYAYKIYVYDPQNVASQEQIDAYNRLVDYADEFDMMSDSEKLELLDMQDDYDGLLDKQKDELNAYFKDKDHVGKTYTSLISELEKLKQELEDESNEGYQSLKAYLEAWDSYSDEQKLGVINYKATYDDLNSVLQKKIDDVARTYCTKSYTSLYSEYFEILKQRNEAQIASLQEQLDSEKANLQELETYADSLESDLAYAKTNNLDVADIQSQIDTNNSVITQTQQTINSLQSQIDSLKAQIQE
ncbi:hypothetical protein [Floccifex sp.]|uniref:hypothetical protein n=1 Tax=Floccifex sp. TaxID=2815810 RepID=UPI0029FF1804|nr:hypothetical protein [Floccifex sp.]MDD7282016.1 hypothetical protein [Erysipelotrichaceae bacterium]MDY2958407.1 hypothetical protein [Floccifex sp.]